MGARRVTVLEHEEGMAVRAKIKAKQAQLAVVGTICST